MLYNDILSISELAFWDLRCYCLKDMFHEASKVFRCNIVLKELWGKRKSDNCQTTTQKKKKRKQVVLFSIFLTLLCSLCLLKLSC